MTGTQRAFERDNLTYDIFECLPGGVSQWVTVVTGLETAKRKLGELILESSHDFFLMDFRTNRVLARAKNSMSYYVIRKPILLTDQGKADEVICCLPTKAEALAWVEAQTTPGDYFIRETSTREPDLRT